MPRTGPKVKVLFMCGCVFAFTGAIILAIAFFLMTGKAEGFQGYSWGNTEILPFVFLLTGGISLAVGLGIILKWFQSATTKKRLLRDGNYVNAIITGAPVDYSVMVNGWPTYRIECQYTDPTTGIVHIFRSENLTVDPSEIIQEREVKVYVEKGGGFKHYYVDIDPILPKITVH